MEQHNARRILAAAVGVGITSDALLQDAAPGINIFLTAGAILLALWLLNRRSSRATFRGRGTGAALLVLLAAGGFALRDSPTLLALAGAGLTACALLGTSFCRTGRLATGVMELLAQMAQTAGGIVRGGVRFLRQRETWHASPAGEGGAQQAKSVARGLLLSAPLVLVFGALLSSADPVFAHFVAAAFGWDVGLVMSHLLWTAAAATLAAGVFHLTRTPPAEGDAPKPDAAPHSFSLGQTETVIALGAVDLLFAAFVLVQMHTFFGGQGAVLSTVGLTYAQYARHGFFELVWAAALCLPLLLSLHAGQKAGAQKPFTVLAGLLIALLYGVMASALGRMNLYRSEYGLTELRLYTTAFMGWLAVVFAWLACTVLRGRREHFAIGAAGFAAAVVVALFVLNPDAAIVRANANRAQAGRSFDACYAASLSADAVPELVRVLPSLPLPAQPVAAARLLARWDTPAAFDAREWNGARRAAQLAVQNNHARLAPLAAAAPAHPCERGDD